MVEKPVIGFDTLDNVSALIQSRIPPELLDKFINYAMFSLDGTLERPIESMETFLFDDYFLGRACKTLYPKVAEALIQFFEGDYIEALVTGGTRWGKSFFASIVLARLLYMLSCYKYPQDIGNIARSSHIYLVNICVTEGLAIKGIYNEAKGIIDLSPFFMNDCPYNPDKSSELEFQKNVTFFPGNSSKSSTIALNIFGGVLDEINSFRVTQKHTMDYQGEFDQAHVLWESLYRRAKDTFTIRGKFPGRLVALGSREYPNDWMEKRIAAYRDDPQVLILEYAQYQTKPRELFLPGNFYIDLGGIGNPPKMVLQEEVDAGYMPVGKLEAIPLDFKRNYEHDLYGSLKDISGIIFHNATNAFFKEPQMVMDCFRGDPNEHPFSMQETTLRDGCRLLKEKLITAENTPIIDPKSVRFFHCDQHRTSGATGIVMGHSAGWTTVSRFKDGNLIETLAPIVRVDFMLRVISPNSFVDTEGIRDLIYTLTDLGFYLRTSFDMVGAESMYRVREKGIDAAYKSVERDIGPYDELYKTISERRLISYYFKPALDELLLYLITLRKGKEVVVDHVRAGMKDLADGLAVLCWRCAHESDTVPETTIVRSDRNPLMSKERVLKDEASKSVNWLRGKKL